MHWRFHCRQTRKYNRPIESPWSTMDTLKFHSDSSRYLADTRPLGPAPVVSFFSFSFPLSLFTLARYPKKLYQWPARSALGPASLNNLSSGFKQSCLRLRKTAPAVLELRTARCMWLYFKGGPEPLEKESPEFLGSKRDDRFSNPFFEMVPKTCQGSFFVPALAWWFM